jgi:hypothetical protein
VRARELLTVKIVKQYSSIYVHIYIYKKKKKKREMDVIIIDVNAVRD